MKVQKLASLEDRLLSWDKARQRFWARTFPREVFINPAI